MELTIYDDGVLRAELVHNGWLFIRWINNTIGHLPKTLVKSFRLMEKKIQENNWKGWLINSEKDHPEMHKLLEKVGGKKYDEDEDYLFFMKEFKNVRI